MNLKRLSLLAIPLLISVIACNKPAQPGGATPATQTATPEQAKAEASPAESRPSGPIAFTNVTDQVGIRFKHNNGAFGKKYLPETLGSGVAFLDYDGDGWQDLLLVNSMNFPGHAGAKSYPALYHNQNGTFVDVTKEAGLAVEMYGLGVAVGDYDNDGLDDIYITCLGPNRLFRNLGGGKFKDVTAAAQLGDPGFSTSAAWFDYDKDGRLDLFVCNYVEWTIEKDLHCTLDGENKSYCTPESYKGQSSTLYHNKGGGRFENVTQAAGLLDATGKSLGVTVLDYDNDSWPDLFVANDTQPNKLYRNNGNGTFTDNAMTAGIAFSETGVARAGMGVDSADYDGSGRAGIVIGNFSNEMMGLYHNEGTGLFIDEAPTSSIGRTSLLTLTFACFFFDYDLDGLPDIFAANGHVSDDINKVQQKVTYAQAPHLFRNLGKKKFEAVTAKVGSALLQPAIARGAAYGDFDNDGDLDLVITANGGRARLFRNDGGNQNNLLRIRTVGKSSNRDGIGAKVTLKFEGQGKLWGVVKSGSSYCSQSELPLTFGLGKVEKVMKVEVLWPSGKVDAVSDVKANQSITIEEGAGVTASQPIAFRSN
jgi:enediyne biosynthesis protein E4